MGNHLTFLNGIRLEPGCVKDVARTAVCIKIVHLFVAEAWILGATDDRKAAAEVLVGKDV